MPIEINKLPKHIRDNPEKLGAVLISEKAYYLSKRVELLEEAIKQIKSKCFIEVGESSQQVISEIFEITKDALN